VERWAALQAARKGEVEVLWRTLLKLPVSW
jgi:hypothetical protein